MVTPDFIKDAEFKFPHSQIQKTKIIVCKDNFNLHFEH